MNFESRLKLSYYRQIAVLNEEHRIYLVQHIETGKIFVKKIMSAYNLQVYTRLMDRPVPGTPAIECLHEEEGELTLIEEYISGDTLEERLAAGAMNEIAVLQYGIKLCDIVKRLHSMKPPVIHRDIKPSNIIITKDERVVLIDLNAARAGVRKEEDTVLLGTKGYAAPEQFGFGSSGVTTDVYAIGMVLNTMLCGSFNSEVIQGAALTGVIRRCTELNPKDRYENVAQLREMLARILWSLTPDEYKQQTNRTSTGYSQQSNSAPVKVKPSRSFYYPPGFRTGKPFHMILACVGYFITGLLTVSFYVPDTDLGSIIAIKFLFLFTGLGSVLFYFNYLGICEHLPFAMSPNPLVKFLARTVVFAIYMVLLFITVALIATSFPTNIS